MEAEAPGALAEGREEPTATQNAGLHHLPHSVVALLLDMLTGTAAGGPRPMLSTTALAGGARAAVAVAFSSKAMLQAVAAAEPLWAAQCERLGWSLAWLAALPPCTSSWAYFCQRMGERHRLRRQLRTLARFLDPLSASALRPPPPLEAIREVEAALQFPLPFALFELYRFCDGQDAARGGVQFLDAARLLSLQEMLQAAQDRYSPLETRRAFEGLTHQRRGEAAAAAAETRRERGGHEQAAGSSSGGGSPSGSSSGRHCVGGWPPEPPAVLLTFTDELRGRKRYCIDLQGRIWLSSGFNDIFLAPNLAALIHRILT